MDDGRDAYLSRNLKNWAVQQQPPVGARERLLKTASRSLLPPQDSLLGVIIQYLKPIGMDHIARERLVVPMTQSQVWSVNIALNMRLVT